ncbi:hypothetical protein EPK99_18205 [Neorhizobium lilium]|uniref:Uncharacterized protein n=1 Tax=Neorhizobium lilium TaxID=2503024 RepID=A0A3S3RQT2_9HYPH|nr:hypothetical protein [Neorhizobium lilium]RWX75629.1 hypothetical protein EPK99_18205 [Neorhizobium lilium]
MKSRSCASLSLAIATATAVGAGPVLALDKPLIWQPSKSSDTSYSVKLGLKLPMELEPEAGFDLGLDTSKSGAALRTPVRFWSSFKAQAIQRPAYEMNREVGFQVDGNARSAAITMNAYEKHIATPSIDVEREGAYAVRYDAAAQQWAGVDVSQSIKVSKTATGTAFVVRASATGNFKVAGAGIGLEQKLGGHMTVSGSLDRSSDVSGAIASINASYSFKW